MGSSARVAALRDPSAETRARAAWWLRRYGTARAPSAAPRDPRDELAQALDHERDPAAALAEVAALAALTRGTRERGHRLLLVLGNGQVPEVARRAAARALGLGADEETVPELIARAAPAPGRGDATAELSAYGLAALPDPLLSAALQQTAGQPGRRAAVLRGVALRGDPRWSAPVLEALGGPRDLAREPLVAAAVEAAESLRLVEAAPLLVTLAEDDRLRSLRARAVRALGSLGGAFDVAVVARCIDAPLTRVAALDAAAALGDPALRPLCAAQLDAALSFDRAAAARCLASLGGDDDALRARAAREDDDAVRDALDDALGLAAPDDVRDAPTLVAALSSADAEWQRVRAANALGAHAARGEPLALSALGSLVARERDLPSPAAIAALRALTLSAARVDDETLVAYLGAAHPAARQSAAHAAGVGGAAAATAALRARAFGEVDDDVCGAMAVVFARALGPRAEETLALLDETAFSPAQVEALAQARRVAGSVDGARVPFAAGATLRRRGYAPGSVWGVTLPDGGLAVGIAGDDGVLLIPGGAAAVHAPRRIDVR